MIFITAKFSVRPEDADAWPEITRSFTEATRSEPGCLWFDWSRSLDDHKIRHAHFAMRAHVEMIEFSNFVEADTRNFCRHIFPE